MDKHIILTCPNCGSKHKVKDIQSAERFVCPRCRKPLNLPSSLVSDEMTLKGQAIVSAAQAMSDDPLLGKKVAGCKIISEVGKGGMGRVYRAHHPRLDKIIALKILSMEFSSPSHKERFLGEARAAAKLEHPNIVQVYDVGEENNICYIIMQYIEGESLEQTIVREKGLDPKRAARILREICRALKVAHDKKLVHRDIKPDNVFLSRDESVRLGDFGLVRDLSKEMNLTAQGVVLGTPYYMAPEQFQSEVIDPRTDIYALGISFFHMLAGRRPFEGNTPYVVMNQHINDDLPDISAEKPRVPKVLVDMARKMAAKKPENRYQTVDEIIAELEAWGLGLGAWGSGFRTPDLKPQAPSPKPKSRVLIAAVMALVLLLGVVSVFLVKSMSKTAEYEAKIRYLMSKGGIENVQQALDAYDASDDQTKAAVKDEMKQKLAIAVDTVLNNDKDTSDAQKVSAAKKFIKKLDAVGASREVVRKKRDIFTRKGHQQVDRIGEKKKNMDTAKEKKGAKDLLSAYMGVDKDLDRRARDLLCELEGSAGVPKKELDVFNKVKELVYKTILPTAKRNKTHYKKARKVLDMFLKSKHIYIRLQAEKILDDIGEREKRGQ